MVVCIGVVDLWVFVEMTQGQGLRWMCGVCIGVVVLWEFVQMTEEQGLRWMCGGVKRCCRLVASLSR